MKKKANLLIICLATLVLLNPYAISAQAQAANPPEASRADQFDKLVNGWTAPDHSSAPTESLAQADPEKVVYLTFDDGPDPKWTPQVLAVLEQYHATGTFYMIGKNARSFPEVIRQLAEAGQTIGNHSYNHINLANLGFSDFADEVKDTDTAIRDALAVDPVLEKQVTPCLRPPYGEVGTSVYPNAFQLGYAVSMWQLDTRDWAGPSPEEILADVSAKVLPYEVVLMHDGGKDRENTVQALALILHELTFRGFNFQPYCTSTGQNAVR